MLTVLSIPDTVVISHRDTIFYQLPPEAIANYNESNRPQEAGYIDGLREYQRQGRGE